MQLQILKYIVIVLCQFFLLWGLVELQVPKIVEKEAKPREYLLIIRQGAHVVFSTATRHTKHKPLVVKDG